ncbi:hypothetical protein niasHS_013706 [Heterodera schachtii]|uniref:Chromo domain-containing protein n=1 Tax=Heterodera schachtii TaxID=97005 RepID=A0ABD2IK70_HETSC
MEHPFELPVFTADDSLQLVVSPANSVATDPVPFGPDVDEVPELGPNPHDQVVEVAEDAVSAAYSSDPEFEWVGFAKEPNDWIPVGDLSHCEESINDYWQRYREGKEYRERKKKEEKKKVKKRDSGREKSRKWLRAAGENEQKEEQKEE